MTQVATILGLTPDNGDTSDLTHPSLTEDVQFGVFISNGDEGGGSDTVLSSIGIWARNSNQLCQASFGQDNVPTATVIAGHVDRNDCVAFRSTTVDGAAERVRAFVDQPIPNGVRIGASVFPGADRNIPIGAMLFAGNGVRANVHQVTISRVVGAITEIDPAIDGRSVDMIVALTSTDQFDGVSHSGFAHQTVSFHAFENEVKQSSVSQSITWRSSNNIETVSNGGRANGIVVADGNHVQADPARHPELATTWEFAIDVVDGMIRIETIRAADENADPEMGLLVAHLDGDKATVGLMTTPSAPSADAVNVDFSPSIDSDLSGLLLQLNNVNTAGVDLIDDPMAGHYGMAMISAAPNADQFGFQTSWEVGADPTNALTTQGDFLNVRLDDGSPAIVVDSDGAEIVDNNLSVVFTDSQTFQFPFLAITTVPVPDVNDRLDSIEQSLTELLECPKPIIEDPDTPGQFIVNPLLLTPLVESVANAILANPASPIVTNGGGEVTTSNIGSSHTPGDVAAEILANPAVKLDAEKANAAVRESQPYGFNQTDRRGTANPRMQFDPE